MLNPEELSDSGEEGLLIILSALARDSRVLVWGARLECEQ